MAHCIHNSLSVLSLLLFTSFAYSYNLRRRSAQNPYDLSDALDVLQRQRRRIDEDEFRRNNLDILRDRFSPYDALDLYNDRPNSLPDKITLEDIIEQYPEYLDSFKPQEAEEMENESKVDTTADKLENNRPSADELKAIFENIETDSKNSQNAEKSMVKEKKEEEKPETLNTDAQNKISESQMTQLLKEIEKEKTGNTNAKTEEKEIETKEEEIKTTDQSEPVTKEELQEVFSETKQNDDDSNLAAQNTNSDHDDAESSKSEDLSTNESDDNIESARKIPDNSNPIVMKKRNAKQWNPTSDVTVAELEAQIVTLRDELERLRLVETLEDKENDFLAAALKEATMAQLRGQDRFLKNEYGYIENAIDVEEVLQNVKTSNDDTVESEIEATEELADAENAAENDDDDDTETEALLEANKRTSEGLNIDSGGMKPTYEDSMGRWFEKPIPEEDEDETDTRNDEAQATLEDFVHNYIENSKAADAPEDGSELMALEDGDDADNDIVIDEDDVERVIDNYVRNIEAPSIEEEEESDICPTVELFTSNCKVADSMGLPIDVEARNLCNRHELCYACGATLGMSQIKCDNGFRSEVIQICGANKNCIRDGAQFLWLIKGDHRYNNVVTDQCAHTCVEDFIVGL